ncbi:MAG: c-type cytochrome [Vulcanimicrobiaceae bacterium]
MIRYTGLFAILFLVIATSACSSQTAKSSGGSTAATAAPASANAAAIANGRSIYLTGKDANGVQVVAQPPALMPSCAACHRPNGAGGMHLPGGAVSADLRYSALVGGQKHPYTLALLERAISTGIDDDGQTLNPVMPRWKLSQRDLHDISYFVLTQLK